MRVHKQKRIDYERQWNNDALVHSTIVEWYMYDKVVLILLFYITVPLYFMVLCIVETQTQLLVLMHSYKADNSHCLGSGC